MTVFIDDHCFCELCCADGHCGCAVCDEPCDCDREVV
jgi:hypothetical protein